MQSATSATPQETALSPTTTDPARLRLAALVRDRDRSRPEPGPQPRRNGDHLRLLLTLPEAARALSIGRSTLYELIAAGQLEVVHIGRSTRVPVVALESFVAALRRR